MQTLFDLAPEFPPGFAYVPDFITSDEEKKLLEAVADIPLQSFSFQGYEAKRRVASFGYDWNFDQQQLLQGKAMPEVFAPLIEKVALHLSMAPANIAELLVTEYPAGAVINWHRDAPPFDLIAGISLLSDCNFRLKPYAARKGRSSLISFPVKRRSLYVMQDASRTDWQHSIAPVKQVRYSITLRTLRGEYIKY